MSHTRPVQDIAWVSKHVEVRKKGETHDMPEQEYANQFLTVAGDGNIVFWDIRPDHWKNAQQVAFT
jgi:hypothetical protein